MPAPERGLTRRHLWFSVPLLAACAGGAGFYHILQRMQAGTYNPHALPSPLIGKHPPAFALPGVAGEAGFSNLSLLHLSQPILVNWFASWCETCKQEAPLLQALAASGIAIWGIAYEDTAAAVASYLQRYSNPYQRLAADATGLAAINWGVYGVPETYFIDKTGLIRLRYAGPLRRDVIEHQLMPLFNRYS